MKIFVSWSGDRSYKMALAIKDWLAENIQATNPWISSDIQKGKQWSKELAEELENSQFGIICLTKENLDSTWIHFEAGAIAKHGTSNTCTVLLDIPPGSVRAPLGNLQHTVLEKTDFLKMLVTINNQISETSGNSLEDEVLRRVFEKNWPDLESKLLGIAASSVEETSINQDDSNGSALQEMAEEMLDILRTQERRRTGSVSFGGGGALSLGSSAREGLLGSGIYVGGPGSARLLDEDEMGTITAMGSGGEYITNEYIKKDGRLFMRVKSKNELADENLESNDGDEK